MNIRTTANENGHQELRLGEAASALHLGASVGQAPGPGDLRARVEKVAAVASAHAAMVDRESRFPREAFDAARTERLLGLAVSPELGGEGIGVADIADICYRLGQACASTALIYAMHQTKMACVVGHGLSSPWHRQFLRRLCAEQLLLASSTTEGQAGGDLRNSAAAVEGEALITLERQATVISYGAFADGLVTTARRAADAASSDQVLVTFLKSDYALEPLNGWDAFGMRGTCSGVFKLRASGLREQILPDS
jgi:acyl-CoA dehydrogenase